MNAWYFVCPSRKLPPGETMSWTLNGEDFVLYRGAEDKEARAFAAHCAHMGTHLANGDVIGNDLRCPLHHRMFDGLGRCTAIPGSAPTPLTKPQQPFPIAEKFGSLFLFHGKIPTHPLPSFESDPPLLFTHGRSLMVDCSLQAIASNGFDMEHFTLVHKRQFIQAPILSRPAPHRLEMSYVSSIHGDSPGELFLKKISGNRIQVRVTCHGGTLMAVESDLGFFQGRMILALKEDSENRTSVTPILLTRKTRSRLWDTCRLWISKILFSSFMKKDLSFMQGMRFHPPSDFPKDPVLSAFLDYFQELRRNGGENNARS